MDTLKFLELAVSKDKTRNMLTGIYRDRNHLVATNGHRMHYSNGLPDAEPHYLDNRSDVTFPEWRLFQPDETKINVRIGLNRQDVVLLVDALKVLKPIAKLVSRHDYPVRIENNSEGLLLRVKDLNNIVNASIKLPIEVPQPLTSFRLCINCNYLLDALKITDYGIIELALSITENDCYNPLLLRADKTTALIMPMRMKD